jgi:hypothetical protein
MAELVAPVLHRLDRSAKRVGRVSRFVAVGQERDASILGFADRPKRWSTNPPLQLKGVQRG